MSDDSAATWRLSLGVSRVDTRRSILYPLFCRSNDERPGTWAKQPWPYSEYTVSPVVFTVPEGHSTRWAIRAFLSAANETHPLYVYIRLIYAPLFTQSAPRRALAKQYRTLPPILAEPGRGSLIYCPRTRFFSFICPTSGNLPLDERELARPFSKSSKISLFLPLLPHTIPYILQWWMKLIILLKLFISR